MRLVTRGDMDGLTCAVLISLNEEVEDVFLIHPQDITDLKVEILPGDILANVPYHPACAMWFDHHQHTATAVEPPQRDFKGAYGLAASAAHLVYDYYGGRRAFPQFQELVRQTDRMDAAELNPEDVLNPQGYLKLGFTIDARTGLGPVEDYFIELVELLKEAPPIESVLEHPSVRERCLQVEENDEIFRRVVRQNSRVDGNVVITDFRGLEDPPVGNRFLIYALYPEVNVSVRVHWGPRREFAVVVVGHSIFNRTCRTDVGELSARYGGGGHRGAGSIPLIEDADFQISQIVAELKAKG